MADFKIVGSNAVKHKPATTGDFYVLPVGTKLKGDNGSIPASLINGGVAPSGVAGGDLSGTYPNPTVNKSTSQALTTPAIAGAVTLDATAQASLSSQLGGLKSSAGAPVINANVAEEVAVQFVGKATNNVYLGEPNQWLEITVGGTVLVLPAYIKV